MISRIRNEGLNNSQVMDIAFYLTDANGPRLQGSPGYTKAANWSKNKLTEWGLKNAQLESWGVWGKGWELQKSYVAMTAPYYKPLIAFPKAWCSGTGGHKSAELILIDAKDSLDLLRFSGKVRGKIVILPRTDTLRPSFAPDARRYTEEELTRMSEYSPSTTPANRSFGNRAQATTMINQNMLKRFLTEQGAIAILSTSPRGKDGTLFVSGGGSYE